jgi:hypothetical protein
MILPVLDLLSMSMAGQKKPSSVLGEEYIFAEVYVGVLSRHLI